MEVPVTAKNAPLVAFRLKRRKVNRRSRAPARIAVEPAKVGELVRCLWNYHLVEWNLDPAYRALGPRLPNGHIIGIHWRSGCRLLGGERRGRRRKRQGRG